jgi:hypothetical protein
MSHRLNRTRTNERVNKTMGTSAHTHGAIANVHRHDSFTDCETEKRERNANDCGKKERMRGDGGQSEESVRAIAFIVLFLFHHLTVCVHRVYICERKTLTD